MTGGAQRLVEERCVVSAEEQRAADARAYASGIEEDALMESAGEGAARWMVEHMTLGDVVALAGPGGNGGDALVAARHLAAAGVRVKAFVIPPKASLAPATVRMLERLRQSGGDVTLAGSQIDSLLPALVRASTVVDGLFGCGMSRPISGIYRKVVDAVNAADAHVVSLDLPSGLSSDRGILLGEAVRADVTLAMQFLKPAHVLFPASGLCGNVAVIPIAYPCGVLSETRPVALVVERFGVRSRLPSRRPDGHKGTFGRVLVVAGSTGMTGAAILCCRATLRAGAGLVSLGCPAPLNPIFEAALPEVITLPLPDEDGSLHEDGVDRLAHALERANVLAIGPGLSRRPGTQAAVLKILERFDGSIVIDADAIRALIGRGDVLERIAGRAILTPHPGEFGALVDRSADDVDADRVEMAREFAVTHGAIVILKGRPTAIALTDGTVYLNPTGNAGLGKGGTGDVLTGLVAGFVAGGASLNEAAIIAPYIHGHAADVYARDRAERSLVPSDLIDLLPIALQEAEQWT